ncbi:MAG TPA: RNA polymerase sigma factor region1.1 domain-containing protein, partial [Candidatus Baltobacteraceae bacterium]|nr:RNA polymerase sigma factor region1.1 domain-containing protein [Candidatus Baltobacteraceae bacterium]
MLRRKKTPGSARKNQRAGKSAKAKAAPMRRRFVITSSARRNAAKAPESAQKPRHTATSIAEAEKRLQNGHANGNGNGTAAPVPQSSVDLTETIKTLLQLAQEHGYITYDDINDILPDNLSPDDLDALLSKLRSLDVEIVMDQA